MQSWPLARSANDASTADRHSGPILIASSSAWGYFTGTRPGAAPHHPHYAGAHAPVTTSMEYSSADWQCRPEHEIGFLTGAGRIVRDAGPKGPQVRVSGQQHDPLADLVTPLPEPQEIKPRRQRPALASTQVPCEIA